jgi:hypothetical protein
MTKITGSGSESISQMHGSADPDPDPHQNAMDTQHWCLVLLSPMTNQKLHHIRYFKKYRDKGKPDPYGNKNCDTVSFKAKVRGVKTHRYHSKHQVYVCVCV